MTAEIQIGTLSHMLRNMSVYTRFRSTVCKSMWWTWRRCIRKFKNNRKIFQFFTFLQTNLTPKHTKRPKTSFSFTCLIIQSLFHSVSSLNVGKWTLQSTVSQHYATTCFQLNVSCISNSSALEEGTELWAI